MDKCVPHNMPGAHRSPGTGVTKDCESPCGGWDPNPGLLQGQQVLSTSEPSLQAPVTCFYVGLSKGEGWTARWEND